MKRWAFPLILLLSACSSQPHNFVVDVSQAEQQVVEAAVIFCRGKPQQLGKDGAFYQGKVIARCKRWGRVRLVNADGTIIDCPMGRVTADDDWYGFQLQGRSCASKWTQKL